MSKRNRGGMAKKDGLKALLFCAPWLLGFLMFTVYPIIQTLIYSFNKVNVTAEGVVMEPRGIQNYYDVLFIDADFTAQLGDYITLILVYVPVILVVSLVIALLLNTKQKGTGFFRTIFFLPVIIASGPVIDQLISQGVVSFPGAIDAIDFTAMGAILPSFLVDAVYLLISSFTVILWFAGIQILVFMTGLQKLDSSMYEAAKIDGASQWECFWKITLPALNQTIVINTVFSVVILSMYNLAGLITRIQNDMYTAGKGFGYAAAEAWIYSLVLTFAVIVGVLIVRRRPQKITK